MNKATAQLNNLRVTPRKVRLVSGLLRGRAVSEAMAQLQIMPWRSAPAITKLLKSAVANAKNKNMNADKLFIESITVGEGPMLKRILPKAMGRGTPIHKRMSHIEIVLSEKEGMEASNYVFYEKTKKAKKHKHTKESKPKFQETKAVGKEIKPGIFQRLFRRKSI